MTHLGAKSINMVKLSDAKSWAIRMSEDGCAYKSIDNYKRSLNASFFMAIQDDCIKTTVLGRIHLIFS